MEYSQEAFSKAIKNIRLGKSYTQEYVSNNELSRTTYSKIENNRLSPSNMVFFTILKNLEISASEFIYIANDYKYPPKYEIIELFSRTSHSNDGNLLKIIELCKIYNNSSITDKIIKDIELTCSALLFLNRNRIKQARKIVMIVWERLSKQETWYFTEIRIINSIFYLLPLDTAEFTVKQAENRLELYNDFIEVNRLKIALHMNLINLKLLNDQISTTLLSDNIRVINLCKKYKKYDLFAISLIRNGLFKFLLNIENYKDDVMTGIHLLEIFEEYELLESIKKELLDKGINISSSDEK